MGNTAVSLEEQVGDVDTAWIMVLTKSKAGCSGEPRDELIASANLNVVSSCNELRLCDMDGDAPAHFLLCLD